jgi:sucrose phosphorylase
MLNTNKISVLKSRLEAHIAQIYPDINASTYADQLVAAMAYPAQSAPELTTNNPWNEEDLVVICYANSIYAKDKVPLQTLREFCCKNFKDLVTTVHILPFYPYCADDGFSVIDYMQVNDQFGDWQDVAAIGENFRVMADLVINHCSRRSKWFDNFIEGKKPGRDYFQLGSPAEDLSQVVRPRASDLLYPVETVDGIKYVWCTFSHDQMDLNFANPELLLEFVRIVRYYLEQGVSVFRLDAIAFIWKEAGTSCINLPQTHEIVRLFRALVEHYDPRVLLITETNIPDRENLTYFGNGNEAHMVYNFPLPPLLLNTLWSGDCTALSRWIMSLPPAQDGTTYFNFIASHDGIGLRPVEGLLDKKQQKALVKTAQKFGGQISSRALENNKLKPYEINISLFSALSGTHQGKDTWGVQRMVCAHAIMMSLEGIPAFYIHSLLGTENDLEKLKRLGQSRAINRHNWILGEIEEKLVDSSSHHSQLFEKLSGLIRIRKCQPAFHPNAVQFTLQLGPGLFGVWRQSAGRKQSIFSVTNVTDQPSEISLAQINLTSTSNWRDLISGQELPDRLAALELQPYQTVWISNSDGLSQFL